MQFAMSSPSFSGCLIKYACIANEGHFWNILRMKCLYKSVGELLVSVIL